MARSIHTTRRDVVREARRAGPREERRRRVKAAFRALSRKRRIKRLVRAERRRGLHPRDAPSVAPDGVPIRVIGAAPHVHHPAGEADLRAVIARLPPGVLTGAGEVALSLGREDQDPPWGRTAHDERDPVTGRPGLELVPGVWSGRVLGQYEPAATRIHLFAYVVTRELPDPDFTALYLKLRALSTFVHEVAHHHDHMTRVARGRWRADRRTTVERYAEAQQHRWTREVVVPYLEEAYPAACDALRAWARREAGVEVSLDELAGDPRTTARSGCVRILFPTSTAFEELVAARARGATPHAARLELARELHFADDFERALSIVEAVLVEDPASRPARVLQADLLEHLGRDDEAEAVARGVLDEDPTCADAWRTLALVHRSRREWRALRDVVTSWLELLPVGWERASARVDRARALLELGDHAALARDLAPLLASRSRYRRAQARGLRAISLLRQGRLAQALAAVEEGLRPGEAGGSVWVHELLAVRADALRRLGRPAPPLEEQTLDWLRRRGHEAWAEELAAIDGAARG